MRITIHPAPMLEEPEVVEPVLASEIAAGALVLHRCCRTLDQEFTARAAGSHPHPRPPTSRAVLGEYVDHLHTARTHRALNQRPPWPPPQQLESNGSNLRRDRLRGLIHEYSRVA